MKVSREQMLENRGRILEAAARLFREKGFDGVSVSEVMKAAGLTHGGFYGHFSSKDELVAETMTYILDKDSGVGGNLSAFVDRYLSPEHRDNAGLGCPTAALAAEARHQDQLARAAIGTGLKAQIDRISRALPQGVTSDRRRAAIGTWAAMVGSMILARAVDDPALSEELLSETKAWIKERLET